MIIDKVNALNTRSTRFSGAGRRFSARRHVETDFVSELCQMTAGTPGKQVDIPGHSDAHGCCGKSLMESALMRVGVRY